MKRLEAIILGLRQWCTESSNSGVITEKMAREMAVCILRQPIFTENGGRAENFEILMAELLRDLPRYEGSRPTKPLALPDRLQAAVAGIADDYMTSEAHHPGYVLIPTDRFEKLAALPGAKS